MTTRLIRVDKDTFNMLELVELEYRRHHPEFDGIKLSKSKLTREAYKYYIPSYLLKK